VARAIELSNKPAFVTIGWAGILVGCICAVRLIAIPFIDPDPFLGAWIGKYVLINHSLPASFGLTTFSATNVAFVPQEWILGVAVALAFKYHFMWLLALLTALFVGGAVYLVGLRAIAFGASLRATLLCLVFVVVNFFGTIAVKQQDLMWVFFAGLFYILDLESAAIFWAIPLLVLWANLHGSIVLAIPVIWIDAATAWYQRGFRSAYPRCILAALAPFAILLTPFGTALPIMVWHLALNPALRITDEFLPPGPHHYFFWDGSFVLLMLVVLYSRTLIRERLRDVIYVAFFLLAAFSAVRNTALLGIAAAPLAARALTLFLRDTDPDRLRYVRLLGTVYVGATCVFFLYLFVAAPVARSLREPNEIEGIVSTMTAVSAQPGEHRLFCEDYAFCSLALPPGGIRVYMNSALPAFPKRAIDDYSKVRFAKPGWQKILSSYRANMVLTRENSALDKALSSDARWKRIPSNTRARLYALAM
jgi:hypothetical protein